MNQSTTKINRVLAISLSANGIGYAVLEKQNSLVGYGNHVIKGDKNQKSLVKVKKHIVFYQPDVLVLQDVLAKDSYRSKRIKRLHAQVIKLAEKHKLEVKVFTKTHVLKLGLPDADNSKYELAQILAQQFPDELAERLPPKRKCYAAEDPRMDIFAAVALATASQQRIHAAATASPQP